MQLEPSIYLYLLLQCDALCTNFALMLRLILEYWIFLTGSYLKLCQVHVTNNFVRYNTIQVFLILNYIQFRKRFFVYLYKEFRKENGKLLRIYLVFILTIKYSHILYFWSLYKYWGKENQEILSNKAKFLGLEFVCNAAFIVHCFGHG